MLERVARAVARGSGPIGNDVRRRAHQSAMFRLRRRWVDMAWDRPGATDATVGRFLRERVERAAWLQWDKLRVEDMRRLAVCDTCTDAYLPTTEGARRCLVCADTGD